MSAPAPPSKSKRRGREEQDDDHSSDSSNNDGLTESLSAAANNEASVDDHAVDDTDLPDDVVLEAKTINDERRWRYSHQMNGIRALLPFHFSPLIRPLTISDLESCVTLENAAFADPAHRCSRDKFLYRLTQCPELCIGVYCTVVPSHSGDWEIETLRTAYPVETGRNPEAVSVLLAHIVATRSLAKVVTDDAMDYPRDYKTAQHSSDNNESNEPRVGHQESGRTICIHSLAVHPKLQGLGLGKLIMKAYMQQAKNSKLADRLALICQEYLVNYYKRFGYSHAGPSQATFSGGGWHDMVFDLGGTIPRVDPAKEDI
ncbi:hypothetical protein F4808DRAFT_455110 [Astrocystis sublimbata]|nr:hypothetical protein F4808DRAFT_455110 [Astrocystis sublimbata]